MHPFQPIAFEVSASRADQPYRAIAYMHDPESEREERDGRQDDDEPQPFPPALIPPRCHRTSTRPGTGQTEPASKLGHVEHLCDDIHEGDRCHPRQDRPANRAGVRSRSTGPPGCGGATRGCHRSGRSSSAASRALVHDSRHSRPRLVDMTEVAPVTDALVNAIRDRLPELRLLTDAVDRESYRRDETAYLRTGCRVRWPSRRRRARSPSSSASAASSACRSSRAARAPACRAAPRDRGRADDRVHRHGQGPRDRRRQIVVVTSPGSSMPHSRRSWPPRACSTRPIRRASRSARSAATSVRTRAACAASRTGGRASRCSGSRS